MKVFDPLSSDSDLDKQIFLRASAGTGKTFSIVHTVLRLICLKSMKPSQITVVTFTRKAAHELKERIASELRKVMGFLLRADAGSLAPYLQKVYLEEGDDLIKRVLQAIFSLESMKISTVHAFARSLYTQLNLKKLEIDEKINIDLSSLQEQILFILSRNQFSREEEDKLKFFIEFFCRSDFKLFSNLLAKLIYEDRVLLPPLTSIELLQDRFLSKLSAIDLDSLIQNLYSHANDYYGLCDRKGELKTTVRESIDYFLEKLLFFEKDRGVESLYYALRASESILSLYGPSNRKKSVKKDSIELESAISSLMELDMTWVSNGYSLLYEILPLIKSKMTLWLEKHEDRFCSDYTLKSLVNLLEKRSLSSQLSPIHALIVDEFQDTDPWQWSIFKNLMERFPEAYYCFVGDPKQAIYAFRQADVYTYLRASKLFSSQYVLSTNWRSSSSLVEVFNYLLSTPAHQNWMRLERTNESICVDKVLSPFTKVSSDESAFELWSFEPTRSSLDWFKSLALVIKDRLPSLINGGPYKDLAIIVADHRQAARIKMELDLYQIPTHTVKSLPLYDSPISYSLFSFIHNLLRWPKLDGICSALNTIIFDWDKKSLEKLLQNPSSYTSLINELQSLHHTLIQKGLPAFLGQLSRSYLSYNSKTIEARFIESERFEYLEEFNNLNNLLLLFWKENPGSLNLFIERFRSYLNLKQEVEDYPQNEDAIEILTVHASKGMEYRYVIALAGAMPTSSKVSPAKKSSGLKNQLTIHSGVWVDYYENNNVYSVLFDLLDEDQKRDVAAEVDGEKSRRLYVEWTRAKEKLIVPWAVSGVVSESDIQKSDLKLDETAVDLNIGKSSPLELWGAFQAYYLIHEKPCSLSYRDLAPYKKLSSKAIVFQIRQLEKLGLAKHCIWKDQDLEKICCKAALQQKSSLPSSTQSNSLYMNRVHTNQVQPNFPKKTYSITSFSRLKSALEADEIPLHRVANIESSEQKKLLGSTLPKGAWVGELWHYSLEKLWEMKKESSQVIDSNYWSWLETYWSSSPLRSYREILVGLTKELTQMPLYGKDEILFLKNLSQNQILCEASFIFGQTAQEEQTLLGLSIDDKSKKTFYRGFIDLCFFSGKKIYFIDYKSNDLGDTLDHYSDEALYECMRHHKYDLQAAIYARAIDRYSRRLGSEYEFAGGFYLFLRSNRYLFLEPNKLLNSKSDDFLLQREN